MTFMTDSHGYPLRVTDAAIVGRQRKALRNTWLPRIDNLPDAVWTPELIGELANILQRRLPAGVSVRIDRGDPTVLRDAAGTVYDGVTA